MGHCMRRKPRGWPYQRSCLGTLDVEVGEVEAKEKLLLSLEGCLVRVSPSALCMP